MHALACRVTLGVLALVLLAGTALAGRASLVLPPGLRPDDATRLRQLTERATVSGRVDGAGFRLTAGVFEYLLDHPEFATHVTQALDVGRYRVWREADGLWLDDGGGAVGRFAIVHAADGTRVVHLRGRYQRRYLPTIHGEALAVLEYASRPAGDAAVLITPTLTGFLRIDNAVVEMLSRLLSDVARAKAERLARRVVGDMAETAQKIEKDPPRVIETLRQRPGIPRRELEEFGRLLVRSAGA